MSGFSPGWLALREPADAAARDPGLLAAAAAFLGRRADPLVVDLGAGTGATLRALAPHLGPRQRWLLVDGDAALAAAGRTAVVDWAARHGLAATPAEEGVDLVAPGRRVAVRWRLADLAADPLPVDGPVDVVTASALFDLVSAAFVERLAAAAAARGAAIYAALDVDGDDAWLPPHPADAAVFAAFRADQGRDKGFGPALGPLATEALAAALGGRGYAVATATSPWRLAAGEGELIAALVAGRAQAAASRPDVSREAVVDWRAARLAPGGVAGCTIGHRDLWAEPSG